MNVRIRQLLQIFEKGAVSDDHLISKGHSAKLAESGLVDRVHGYNIITAKGIECILELDLIDADWKTIRSDQPICLNSVIADNILSVMRRTGYRGMRE